MSVGFHPFHRLPYLLNYMGQRNHHKAHRGNFRDDRQQPDKPPINDKLLLTSSFESACGRKKYFLDLKENDKGKFLSICEVRKNRRDRFIVAQPDIDSFAESLLRLIEDAKDKGILSSLESS